MNETTGQPAYAANLSMLFAELPVNERAAAAVRQGFRLVESWWPFATAAATPGEIDSFGDSLDRAGVRLVLLNLTAGGSAAIDRGILTDQTAEADFEANLESVCLLLARTGCRTVHALYGNRIDPTAAAAEDAVALSRIVRVANRIAEFDGVVVIETLNTVSSPNYPLVDIERTASVVTEAARLSEHGNVSLLLDTYHLTVMGTDPALAVRRFGSLIGHVQFADAPGRGKPGTGTINFDEVLGALHDTGFSGYIGLEYDPTYPQSLADPAQHHTEETP